MTHQHCDVAVVGGGPAGAAAAILLARWGCRVSLFSRPPRGRSVTESLPPSLTKPLTALGVQSAVDHAGFYRSSGNTVWWGQDDQRSEPFADGRLGYQVSRPVFDAVLRREAAAAGAQIRENIVIRHVDLDSNPRLDGRTARGEPVIVHAQVVLDCSGRSGVIARHGLRIDRALPSTLALVGRWRRSGGWDVPDATHTLVESYGDGWAWSVPVSGTQRDVAVMVDPHTTGLDRTGVFERRYRAELAKTRRLGRRLDGARLVTRPWACDASEYRTDQPAGPNFLLVGDAASFVDPLSSFGVKKALVSAWLAAVVTRTILRHPERGPAARELYTRRETTLYEASRRRADTFFTDVAQQHPHPFWLDRAHTSDGDDVGTEDELDVARLRSDPAVIGALRALQQASSVRLQRTRAVQLVERPTVRDEEVVLEPWVTVAGWPGPGQAVKYLRDVDLPRIIQLAGEYDQVPELFNAYQRGGHPVALADFLGALSVLVAKGALHNVTG